jgi:hypothetical protein
MSGMDFLTRRVLAVLMVGLMGERYAEGARESV